jgi:hypothetical protein
LVFENVCIAYRFDFQVAIVLGDYGLILNIFKRARIRYILRQHSVSHAVWLEVIESLYLLQGLTTVEKAHLRELTTLFVYEKDCFGAQGFRLSDFMRVSIAVQACLPILHLGLQWFSDWTDLIVYPGPFHVSRDSIDNVGVMHHQEQNLSGESWSRGPVIVSWADVEREMQEGRDGANVVIHEIAHKLDGLNGSVNGFPPLHHDMPVREWTAVMTETYQCLLQSLEHHRASYINSYAATSPAEFFAVSSECFFCRPEVLHSHFPEVYRQLQLFYRQNPLQRLQSDR